MWTLRLRYTDKKIWRFEPLHESRLPLGLKPLLLIFSLKKFLPKIFYPTPWSKKSHRLLSQTVSCLLVSRTGRKAMIFIRLNADSSDPRSVPLDLKTTEGRTVLTKQQSYEIFLYFKTKRRVSHETKVSQRLSI